jgi:hypothetical protein
VTRVRLLTGWLVAAGLLGACARRGPERAEPDLHRRSSPSGDTISTAAPNARLEPGALGMVKAVPVEGSTGPGGRPFEVSRRTSASETGPARRFGTITLPIALRNRSAEVGAYPCSACHFGRTVMMAKTRIPDAHRNVTLSHPVRAGARCVTCHVAEDVGTLTLASGEHASIDQSYRLCAQCHFNQAESWAGGSHGKRLDGWQGRRVVLPCTDCHDPHRPAVPTRIPFRAPQLEKPRNLDP